VDHGLKTTTKNPKNIQHNSTMVSWELNHVKGGFSVSICYVT